MRTCLALVLALGFASTAVDAAAQVPTLGPDGWIMPGPSVSAQMESYGSGSYEEQIYQACAYYGCNPDYLITIMNCESGGDMDAVAYNPVSGNYTYGIFQIDGMWGGGGMTASEQIWWAAEHITAGDVWWACG